MKELRVIVVLLSIIGAGSMADRLIGTPPPRFEQPTLHARIANHTPQLVHVLVERCGFADYTLGDVPPFRTDTFAVPATVAPPGSAVSLLGRSERTNEHYASLVLALPQRAVWPLVSEWELHSKLGRGR